MTIYTTPFKASTKQPTAPSTDSGFTSIDQVVELMGPDHVVNTGRMVIYGSDEDRVAFSDFAFLIDDDNNKQ